MTGEKKKRVVFKLEAPKAGSVLLAGSFNGWNPTEHPLRCNVSGVWQRVVYLEPGTYEYRFVVDGKWSDHDGRKEEVLNQFGTYNAVVRV